MSQHLNTLKIYERNNGRSLSGFFSTPKQQFLAANSSNNENTVKSTAFWLSAWKKVVIRGGNCQGNRKLGADPAKHFARTILRRN